MFYTVKNIKAEQFIQTNIQVSITVILSTTSTPTTVRIKETIAIDQCRSIFSQLIIITHHIFDGPYQRRLLTDRVTILIFKGADFIASCKTCFHAISACNEFEFNFVLNSIDNEDIIISIFTDLLTINSHFFHHFFDAIIHQILKKFCKSLVDLLIINKKIFQGNVDTPNAKFQALINFNNCLSRDSLQQGGESVMKFAGHLNSLVRGVLCPPLKLL